MSIAVELNLGVPFLDAIGHASLGRGCCAREFEIVAGEVKEQGASMQDALRHFSERIGSRLVKRSVMQLAAAFEHGGSGRSGEPVKRIAMEILTRQRVESKLFSGKLVMFSLLFIAVSAIVPALFQSFSLVGSAILSMSFTATQLFLIIAVGFPLLDIAVLLYIRAKTPFFLRGRQ
jgi:pilus assembly protein TadC